MQVRPSIGVLHVLLDVDLDATDRVDNLPKRRRPELHIVMHRYAQQVFHRADGEPRAAGGIGGVDPVGAEAGDDREGVPRNGQHIDPCTLWVEAHQHQRIRTRHRQDLMPFIDGDIHADQEDVGPPGKAERPGEWPCRARWSADDGAARECAGVGDRVQVQSHSGPQHHDRERGEEPAPGSPPATPQCPQVLEWCGRTPGKLAPHVGVPGATIHGPDITRAGKLPPARRYL